MITESNVPEIIVKEGVPAAVLINIDDYEDMLKRLGDTERLRMIERIRSNPQTSESL